jgi:hypothetical protein
MFKAPLWQLMAPGDVYFGKAPTPFDAKAPTYGADPALLLRATGFLGELGPFYRAMQGQGTSPQAPVRGMLSPLPPTNQPIPSGLLGGWA